MYAATHPYTVDENGNRKFVYYHWGVADENKKFIPGKRYVFASLEERESILPRLSVLRLTSPTLSASKSLMAVPRNTPPGKRTHLIEAAQLSRKLRCWSINCTK